MAHKDNDDRTIDQFCAEVQGTKMFSAEEEAALFKRYRTCKKCRYSCPPDVVKVKCPKCASPRDLEARDLIVQSVLRFVIKEARAYVMKARGRKVSDPELLKSLISAGTWGALIAVDKFDPREKTRFMTYAPWWIRAKILDELDHTGVVHVPAYRQKAHRAELKYSQRTELEPQLLTVEDLSVVENAYADRKTEELIFSNDLISTLHAAFEAKGVSRRDRYIVFAYYGIREPVKSLHQIAESVGMSWERVRQIKESVITAVRTHVEQNNLESVTQE